MKARTAHAGAQAAPAPRVTSLLAAAQTYSEAEAALGALATLTRQKPPDNPKEPWIPLPRWGMDDLTLRLYARFQGAQYASKYTRRALAEIADDVAAVVKRRACELAEEDLERAREALGMK